MELNCERGARNTNDEKVSQFSHKFRREWSSREINRIFVCSKSPQTTKMATITKTKSSSFECVTCNKILASKQSLARHSQILHSSAAHLSHRCEFCFKKFNQKFDLLRHLTRHTGAKDFMCPICDERFNTQKNLKYHVEKHSSLNRYQCDLCGKIFVGMKLLKAHQVTHVSSETFPCSLCGPSYRNRSYLRNHIMRHLDNRRFTCDFAGCDKTFKCRSSLRNHQRRCHGEDCDVLAKQWEIEHKKEQLLIFDYPIKVNGSKVEIEINNDTMMIHNFEFI